MCGEGRPSVFGDLSNRHKVQFVAIDEAAKKSSFVHTPPVHRLQGFAGAANGRSDWLRRGAVNPWPMAG